MKKRFHLFWRTGLFGFHAAMLLVFMLALLGGGIVWRLTSSPLDIGFAKSYLEDAFYDAETGNHAIMDGVVLYWPDLAGPLYIGLTGVKILNPQDDVVVSVDEAMMSFSRSGLLLGKILPKTIVLKSPLLRISRLEDNQFDFGFGEDEPEINHQQEDIITRMLGYVARPGYEAANDSIISRLQALEIDKAQLVVTDHVLGVSWYLPDFNASFSSTHRGMNARFDLTLPENRGKPSGIKINMDYGWDSKEADMSVDVRDFNLMVLAGKMPEMQLFQDMNKTVDAHLEGHLAAGFMPKFFGGSVSIDDVDVKAQVNFERHDDSVLGKMRLSMDKVAQSRIDAFWPNALRGDASEEWIVQKMADGVFKNLWVDGDLVITKGEKEPSFDVQHVKAGFAFENMSVDYRHPLPPATGLYGNGNFDLDKDELRIAVDKGKLGDMQVKKSSMLFDRVVAVGQGDAHLDIHLTSGLRDILKYISIEPISMGDRLDMDVDKVKGQADVRLRLQFPAHHGIKLEDFKIGANGTLSDVFLPGIVHGLDVSGGPMNLKVENGEIHVDGKGMLDRRDMDFSWMEFLDSKGKKYKSKVSAMLTVDPNLRQELGINLDDFIEGSLGVSLNYTAYQDESALIDMDVDMTPGVFFVEPFDYAKPSGEKASASLLVHLKNKELQSISDLSAKGKDFTLSKSIINFKTLKGEPHLASGNLNAFTLGETRGKLNFEFDKSGRVKIIMDAPFLDVRPFLAAKQPKEDYSEPPMIVSVTAKTMRTAPQETVSDARMYIDIDGQGRFNQMEMDATAGSSPIYLRYKPDQEGKRVFRLQTEDAGAALKAFQVYSGIRGGTLTIYGEPVRGVFDRNLIGKAEIKDFRVVDAPVLTRLLSLMSLSGIVEMMSGEGLNFSRLEADFSWVYRKSGSLLVLKNGRTSGNSIGLTFDGTFDNAKHEVDVSGTIVPMSGINNVIGHIPLIGDILTGGSGGVFAATYTIKGPSEKPEVGFNPLSVLTPGILRRILFE